ncbi:GNAT family N-acetyltransferase [Paenibacillus sp. sptzw28]|uniref:GNAT family N-acetyltransferase n=1 Tax=Paenibacillus sp. sptzw28 TaxID=715179 RepID=UPI001C6DD5AE|nr:GNAT family protein [Paenibacillus sp. sptzw28]QYR19631.1 GNAT family N-acetyltransferase [Paenibacillus sp. sptzw28]
MKSDLSLHSERLTYRQTVSCDLDTVLSIENDSENIRYIIPWSKDQHVKTLNDPDKKHIIIEDKDKKLVGYIILAGLNSLHDNVELIRITISEKSKGYGKEALNTILKYIFEYLHAHRLWLDVKEYNERAKHIYLSLGFKQEGILRECIKNGDKFESLIIMSILKHEFSELEEGRDIS